MTGRSHDPDEAMRRLERAARERARGERLPGPDARSPHCEVCGSPQVRWGALCGDCRSRLRGTAGERPPQPGLTTGRTRG